MQARIHKIRKNILDHPDFLYLIKNGSSTFLSYFVTAIFTFLATYLLANYFDKNTVGVYRYIYSFYPIISAICLSGLSLGLLRSISSGNINITSFALKTKIKFSFFGFLACIIISIYYYLNNNLELSLGFLSLGISLPIFEVTSLIIGYLQGHKRFYEVSVFQIYSKFLFLLGIIISIFIWPNGAGIIFFSVGVAGLIQGLYAYSLSKKDLQKDTYLNSEQNSEYHFNDNSEKKIEQKLEQKKLSKYSYNTSIMGFIYAIGSQVDKIILFKFFGPIALAGYWIATILPLEFQRMLTTVTSIYFPKIVEVETKNIKYKFLGILGLATFACIILSVIYYFISGYLFNLFFPEYLEYLFYSQLAFWGICFAPFSFIWSYFILKGETKKMYFLYIGDPIIQILLYLILVPKFGITGLIIATLIKNFLFNIFGIILFIKK